MTIVGGLREERGREREREGGGGGGLGGGGGGRRERGGGVLPKQLARFYVFVQVIFL